MLARNCHQVHDMILCAHSNMLWGGGWEWGGGVMHRDTRLSSESLHISKYDLNQCKLSFTHFLNVKHICYFHFKGTILTHMQGVLS